MKCFFALPGVRTFQINVRPGESPCYDKSSCLSSEVLARGAEFSGHDSKVDMSPGLQLNSRNVSTAEFYSKSSMLPLEQHHM